MSLSVAARRARLLVVRDLILASGDGALWLLDGPMAPNPTAAISGTPLAIVALDLDAFTLHETDATLVISAVGNAATSGLPTWARFVDGDGAGVLDVTAGPAGSGAQAIVADIENPASGQIWTGGQLAVTLTWVEG